MDMQQPPLRLDPDQLVTARLAVQDWNIVLTALNEVPMPQRLTRPVTDNLIQQLRLQQSATLAGAEAVGRAVPDGS
jgi:hypothetical protein